MHPRNSRFTTKKGGQRRANRGVYKSRRGIQWLVPVSLDPNPDSSRLDTANSDDGMIVNMGDNDSVAMPDAIDNQDIHQPVETVTDEDSDDEESIPDAILDDTDAIDEDLTHLQSVSDPSPTTQFRPIPDPSSPTRLSATSRPSPPSHIRPITDPSPQTDPIPILTPSDCPKVLRSLHMLMAIELQQLCTDAQVPIHYYDKILRLFKKYSQREVQISKIPCHDRLMKILRNEVPCVKPKINPVKSNPHDVVPTFSFLEQVLDLMSSRIFSSIEHCCVNANETNRYKKYMNPKKDGYSEMTSGDWYKKTATEFFRKEGSTYIHPETGQVYENFVIPVIFYNDKTGVSAMEGSYSLEPFMFTLGIIKRNIRELKDAWRHLGFIPSCTDAATKSSPEKLLQFTHECMSILLEELAKLQKEPPLVEINLFGKLSKLRLKFEVAYVMGDQLSQDTHCCRKKINAGGAGRIHRGCFTSFLKSSTAPEGDRCPEMPKEVIDKLCDATRLWDDLQTRTDFITKILEERNTNATEQEKKEIEKSIRTRSQLSRDILEKVCSLYPVRNAWDVISFGINKNGIHRATLDDPMHYNSGGLFMYLAQTVFGGLLPKEQQKVEKYLREEASTRSSARYDFPRGKFTPGFTNCTLLTATEKVGIIHSLYLGLGTKRIADIFETAIRRQQNKYIRHPSLNPSIPEKFQNSEEKSSKAAVAGSNKKSALKRKASHAKKKQQIKTPSVGKKTPRKPFSQKQQHASSQPPSISILNLPKECIPCESVGEQYFFKEASKSHPSPMVRNASSVRMMVEDMNSLGLLDIIYEILDDFDDLHTEYILQATYDRVSWHRGLGMEDGGDPNDISLSDTLNFPDYWVEDQLHSDAVEDASTLLHHKLRQRRSEPTSFVFANSHAYEPIQTRIKKHWCIKPKVSGVGDTSAVLTNVRGLRKILEQALVFHGLIHNYHNLDVDEQKQIPLLSKKIVEMMQFVFNNIYRGDQGVDVLTCKCHAHFHLTADIQYFGAPMGFDASKGERNLKWWAKSLSKTARKCGQATFIQQTAQRLSDYLLLQRAYALLQSEFDAMEPSKNPREPIPTPTDDEIDLGSEAENRTQFNFTRTSPHLHFNPRTQVVTSNGNICSDHTKTYLSVPVKQYLSFNHRHCEGIDIWKEIRLVLPDSQGKQSVRAYHHYDVFGSFFDWVHLSHPSRDPKDEDKYIVAKVLLLYRLSDSNETMALVWQGTPVTEADTKWETNISARWKMQVDRVSKLPILLHVPMSRIERCIKVHQHWKDSQTTPIPSPESNVDFNMSRTGFFVDELYFPYQWPLHFIQYQQSYEIEE